MNKVSFLSIVLISSVISCNAQKIEERPVAPFTKLQAKGAANIIFTDSDTLSLRVKGKEGDLKKLTTKVEDGVLYISNEENLNSTTYVYIKNNTLNDLMLSGACEFKTTNPVKRDAIELNVSGAVNLNAKFDTKKITCLQSGATSVNLQGTTDELSADISGASNFKGYNMTAKNATVVATGASNAKVYASERMKANAAGASDIRVKGNPAELSAEASSAASVTRILDEGKKSSAENDTTSYNFKKKKILVISGNEDEENAKKKSHDPDDFKHWKGFSMGVNGYLSPSGTIEVSRQYSYMDLNYGRSFNFQFNLIERQFNLVQNYVKIVTGFGFDYHLYQFARKTNLTPDSSFTWGRIDSTGQYSYQKNKLRCTYLQVPLLLEFNTSNDPDKTFHVAVGVVGQYLIASRTKQELTENNNEFTRVRKDWYNLSPFGAKAHVNLGYKNWTVFGEYSLTTLFQPQKGPELYPFTAGIRLVPFS